MVIWVATVWPVFKDWFFKDRFLKDKCLVAEFFQTLSNRLFALSKLNA
ncbi:hypothetical protein JCM19239_7117 [Vibrio variabilis]|uniref:Uncharacterized protein n=1 Tax=Vibrio variabilis TaxID=990271 RepID=A0ABQ0JM26_9VIBR|nr:hypothetical protein JCM19239_7117 [Vibrio variabilis]